MVDKRMLGLIKGYCVTQAIHCVVRFGIADHLSVNPMTSATLATLAGCSPLHLDRLLRALCDIGIFEYRDGTFANTEMSSVLRRDHPDSLSSHALLHGAELYGVYGKLYDNVVSGTPAWILAMEKPAWEYFAEHPDRGALFDDTMRRNHGEYVSALVAACRIGDSQQIIDVGGGDGALLQASLEAVPSARGVLFDLPDVVARARTLASWQNIKDRCDFIGGDVFQGIPNGGDVYFLKHVLHDWDDEACIRILEHCRSALEPTARLLIVEELLDSGSQQLPRWVDVGVMVFGGRERQLKEFRELLARAGLEIHATTKAPRGFVLDCRLAA